MEPRPLLFVHVAGPGKEKANRKTVRAWVTRRQHDRRRDRVNKQLQAVASACESGVDHDANSPPSPDRPCSTTIAADSSLQDVSSFQTRPTRGRRASRSCNARRKPTVEPHRHQHRQLHVVCKQPQQFLQLIQSPDLVDAMLNSESASSDLSPTMLVSVDYDYDYDYDYFTPHLPSLTLHGPGDMLSAYAHRLGIEPATLWDRYIWQEKVHGGIFRAQLNRFHGFAPRCLHPLILSNPAMLATTVLFTACHIRYQQCEPVMTPELHRIHSLAYKYVQAAIDNDLEQLSDATLLAIIKLALFEVIFGHWAAFRIHMLGIARMVRLRNGLANLGMDGYTAHLLIWFDSQLSAVTGSPRFLDAEVRLAKMDFPIADPHSFVLGVEPLDDHGLA